MPGYARICPDDVRLFPDDVRLFPMMSRCRVCPTSAFWDASGPTPRLSRAAERAVMQRHTTIKEYMVVNQGWRRRLQAMLGRGMADDGRSARPTVNRAGTRGSPTRAGTRRDAIGRRAIRHTIRHQAVPHAPRRDRATGDTAHDPATGPTARDDHPRRRTPRRAIRHATTLSYPMMSDDV